MTPELLEQVGTALYGDNWQNPLCRALGVNERSMRRWRAGTAPIPSGIVDELARICRETSEELAYMADTLANITQENDQ